METIKNLEISCYEPYISDRYLGIIDLDGSDADRDAICKYLYNKIRTYPHIYQYLNCIGIGHLCGDDFLYKAVSDITDTAIIHRLETLLIDMGIFLSNNDRHMYVIDICLLTNRTMVVILDKLRLNVNDPETVYDDIYAT